MLLPPSPDDKLLDFAVEVRDAQYQPAKAFISREMVQATLPHRDPGDVPAWSRVNGNYALTVQPGWNTWQKESIGYPYGTIPRLLIFWLTTEALRTDSRRLEIGGSLTEFMNKLGLDSSRGGKRSDARRLRDQMERLFRARISFEYRDEKQKSWYDLQIAPKGMIWWNHNLADEPTLWEHWVELSDDFFRAITAHPVPVDMNALQHLKGSALALDLYAWLTHEAFRCNTRSKSRRVAWRLLHEQFGADYSDIKNFSRKAMEALAKIRVVFPGLEVETFRGGLTIKPGELAVSSRIIPVGNPQPKVLREASDTLSDAPKIVSGVSIRSEPFKPFKGISEQTRKTAAQLLEETGENVEDVEQEFYENLRLRKKSYPKHLGKAFLGFVRRKIKLEKGTDATTSDPNIS